LLPAIKREGRSPPKEMFSENEKVIKKIECQEKEVFLCDGASSTGHSYLRELSYKELFSFETSKNTLSSLKP